MLSNEKRFIGKEIPEGFRLLSGDPAKGTAHIMSDCGRFMIRPHPSNAIEDRGVVVLIDNLLRNSREQLAGLDLDLDVLGYVLAVGHHALDSRFYLAAWGASSDSLRMSQAADRLMAVTAVYTVNLKISDFKKYPGRAADFIRKVGALIICCNKSPAYRAETQTIGGETSIKAMFHTHSAALAFLKHARPLAKQCKVKLFTKV